MSMARFKDIVDFYPDLNDLVGLKLMATATGSKGVVTSVDKDDDDTIEIRWDHGGTSLAYANHLLDDSSPVLFENPFRST